MSKWPSSHCGQLSVICTMMDWPTALQRPANWPPLFWQLISKHALHPSIMSQPCCQVHSMRGRCAIHSQVCASAASNTELTSWLGILMIWAGSSNAYTCGWSRSWQVCDLQAGSPARLASSLVEGVACADGCYAPVGPGCLADVAIPARSLQAAGVRPCTSLHGIGRKQLVCWK